VARGSKAANEWGEEGEKMNNSRINSYNRDLWAFPYKILKFEC